MQARKSNLHNVRFKFATVGQKSSVTASFKET
uniref:Uncharacterized protein n=1 Tax=Anguilla anguilla TaxID=7936 RepID=A0A0E9SS03_ANGAN